MMRATVFLLASAMLAAGPARADDAPAAADVMGGQGRGSGSGRSSMDHALGADLARPGRPVAPAVRYDDPRVSERQGPRPRDAQPADAKMTRIGGTPGELPSSEARAPAGAPGGSEPEHDVPATLPSGTAR